jgi:signal peptidase I
MKPFYKKLFIFLFLAICVFLVRTFVVQLYVVNGNSMLPTLKTGSLLLTIKVKFSQRLPFIDEEFSYGTPELKRLDMILFEGKERDILVKRAIGLPGDYYSFRDNRIYIDSLPLEENYKLQESKTIVPVPEISENTVFFPTQKEGRIPPDYYLLLGDNREHSYDSRNLGLVPTTRLRGKVLFILKN